MGMIWVRRGEFVSRTSIHWSKAGLFFEEMPMMKPPRDLISMALLIMAS